MQTKKKHNAQIIKKMCAILLLIALFLNTNFVNFALKVTSELTVSALTILQLKKIHPTTKHNITISDFNNSNICTLTCFLLNIFLPPYYLAPSTIYIYISL